MLSNGPSRGETMSDGAESAFTRELIDEIRRDGYRPRAWRRLLSRSWARSLDDIQESPARTRSFWWWAGGVAVAGSGVVFLAWLFHRPDMAVTALVLWLPWYTGSVFFVLTHLGMADDNRGAPYHSLLLSNGLSFLRLSLAPLVLMPCLITPVHPISAPIFAMFIAGLAVTDVLDGRYARRRKICTRLGHMLDYLGDLAFLAFLACGLYLATAIPGSLLLILIIRYPLSLIGVVILYFTKGPAPLTPTVIGRVTTLATNILLLVIACELLLATNLLPSLWIDWSAQGVQFLIAANILYLLYRGVTWGTSEAPAKASNTK